MGEATVFVGHEFSPRQRDDLRGAIRDAFDGSGFVPTYADDVVGTDHILEKISLLILASQFTIFDLSNPAKSNVFLELGYAMALGKRVYLLCEKGAPIPSDLAGYERLEYGSYASLSTAMRSGIVRAEHELAAREMAVRRTRYRPQDDVKEPTLLAQALKQYPAVSLRHKVGYESVDPTSTSQAVWVADLALARGHIVYGPYESPGPAGRYRVLFKLKFSHHANPRDAALVIDVFGASHADRNIYAAEFHQADTYQFFGLDFDYAGDGLVEYRVYNIVQVGRLTVDYVAVLRLADA